MDEYFECERYRCTMKRRFCLERILPKKRLMDSVDTGCQGCDQGREIAKALGVVIPSMDRKSGKKKCRACGETKPVSDFYYNPLNKSRRSEYSTYCMKCTKDRENEARMIRDLEKEVSGL